MEEPALPETSKLVDILEAFNRKERNLLIRDILGHSETKLPLSSDFVERIRKASGVALDPAAWWATDFHFDWLIAAAKMLSAGIQPDQVQSEGAEPMTWTQEDADLVVADSKHLILIEAKAYGAYSNERVKQKCLRFENLCEEMAGSGIDLHFLLMSPRKPQKLDYPEVRPPLRWLPLKIPADMPVRRVERCDANGKRSADKGHWHIVTLPAAKAVDGGEGS